MSAEKKSVGSTAGMGTSVSTSDLLTHRANSIVPDRMTRIETAILNKDFETFANITMQVNSINGTVVLSLCYYAKLTHSMCVVPPQMTVFGIILKQNSTPRQQH